MNAQRNPWANRPSPRILSNNVAELLDKRMVRAPTVRVVDTLDLSGILGFLVFCVFVLAALVF